MKANVYRLYNFQDPTIHNPEDPFEYDSFWTRVFLNKSDLVTYGALLRKNGGYSNFTMEKQLESIVPQCLGERHEITFIDVFLREASPISVGGFVEYIRSLE